MTTLPRRQSLALQTIAFLGEQISSGKWQEWLPPERALAGMLQVSRVTVRQALVQLRRDGVIEAEHGRGNRIRRRTGGKSRGIRSSEVALLTSQPLELLNPSQALWIDELRAMLGEHGCRLHLIHSRQLARKDPRAALEKLARQQPHGCWILTKASAGAQRWFAERSLPCLVAGSCHDGVNLPFRDVDYRATCRHAAGFLLGLGHRRLAMIGAENRLAGDLESERGFTEATASFPAARATATIVRHDATAAGVVRALNRLLRQPAPPTALLVANAYHFLTVMCSLQHAARPVPGAISVISRDDDSFLAHMVPSPARYVVRSHEYAKLLLPPVLEILDGGKPSQPVAQLMPSFVRGETVASPGARS